MANDFEHGVLIGLLVGEGHFGGDGRQPQVTLRMNDRHEALFRWIERTYPGSRLYGPYEHGGRRYYQWMARGRFLREELVPILRRGLSPSLDRYAYTRFHTMCERYAAQLGPHDGTDASGDLAPWTASRPSGAVPEATTGAGEGARTGGGTAPSRVARIFAALHDAGTASGASGST